MQYEDKKPGEYLENLENDWRKVKLMQIREMIKNNAPSLNEGIEYKMLCYGDADKRIFHLNAQRNYVSLYVGNISKVENAEGLLKDFDIGKGCIRVKKRIDLTKTSLEAFIKKTMENWAQGKDTNC